MEVVVNDTNIFFDLIAVDLLDSFFNLPIEVHTTDFVVYHEIKDPKQLAIVERFIQNGNLILYESDFTTYSKIFELKAIVPGLSPADCSVWNYSKENNYTLLSGDKLLRQTALKDKVSVKGLLYIFELLIIKKAISPLIAADKLEYLIQNGSRLPVNECNRLIKNWRRVE